MELHAVSEVMTKNVKSIRICEQVRVIGKWLVRSMFQLFDIICRSIKTNHFLQAELLLSNRHMSFPVVDDRGFCGVINRIDLTNLLQFPEQFRKKDDPPNEEQIVKFHAVHTDKVTYSWNIHFLFLERPERVRYKEQRNFSLVR